MANPKPTLFETLAQQAATASQRANVYEQACASTATKIVEKLQAAIGATPTTLRVMKLTASAQDAERQVGQGVMLPRGNFVFGFEVVVGEVIVPFREAETFLRTTSLRGTGLSPSRSSPRSSMPRSETGSRSGSTPSGRSVF
jgi:hypothetical protein